MPNLILASTSPYRRELLNRLGLDFDVRDATIDESALPGEKAAALALRLARAKAENAVKANPGADEVIIGADQVASRDGELLRKPMDHDTALDQLLACQGKTVLFHTATIVVATESDEQCFCLEDTEVEFLTLDARRLDRYLRLEQPYDCAGGFKAEGLGISLFKAIRSNDPTALLGLPMIWLSQTLRERGFDPLDSNAR